MDPAARAGKRDPLSSPGVRDSGKNPPTAEPGIYWPFRIRKGRVRPTFGWIIDRYQVKSDKASGITNDPNDWTDELGDPRYEAPNTPDRE